MGAQILSLARVWCNAKSETIATNLDCIMPSNLTAPSKMFTGQLVSGSPLGQMTSQTHGFGRRNDDLLVL